MRIRPGAAGVTVAGAAVAAILLSGPAPAVPVNHTSPSPSPSPSGNTKPPHGQYPHDEPTLSPWRVVPGQRIRITDYCADKNGVTASAPVFDPVELTNRTKDGRGVWAIAVVRADTKPGTYEVHVRCPPDGGLLAKLVVKAAQTSKKPKGAAATGGGGQAAGWRDDVAAR